ncbi:MULTISPECIES: glycosyltransferase family 4 protein [Microbacterium]|uniref:glycosyltransferase family 4 protein n=1 Tax=Microbacterium TaxID=33882 RepID=UPI001BB1BA89|nr:glycosyltransferase family 1 protein [Microbacterium sp. 4NA327F11]MCK9919821.1 glycosyltransferase family 4 protein [Microbacteriaceae bacterium K1510]
MEAKAKDLREHTSSRSTSEPRFRIAIDARIINTSTGTYVQRLLEHLQDVDTHNEYTVLVPEKDREFWKPRASNFAVAVANYANYSLAEQWNFLRFLNARKFDLVHFCMPQQPILYRGRRVTTFHDLTLLKTVNIDKNPLMFRFKQLVGRVAFRSAAHKSSVVLCPTRFTREEVVRLWPGIADRTVVTYEAAEIESHETSPVDLPFQEFLLYVGSHSSYKNINRLVDAHQLVRRERPGVGLVFAGSINGAARMTMEHVAAVAAEGVHFSGFVSVAERNTLYQQAIAYVFPSLMEGFGLPGLEAMLWGTPVVSSDATCLPEVYGDAAEYFDPLSVPDIARAILAVIDNPERRAELSTVGRARVGSFSWRTMAEQTHGAYLSALGDAVR